MKTILYIILIEINLTIGQNSIFKIVFLAENQQPELAGWFADALRDVESGNQNVNVQEHVILIDRDNEEEAYEKLCSSLSSGVHLLLDVSWFPWSRLQPLSPLHLMLRSSLGDASTLLQGLLQVLQARSATDAVFILQNEQVMEQTLYRLLGRSVLRVMALTDLQQRADHLKSMRPIPSHHVILGTTVFVQDTYKLAKTLGLITLSDRWTLALVDLRASRLDVSQLRNNTHVVSLAPSAACRLQERPHPCQQDNTLIIDATLMSSIVKLLLEVLMEMKSPQLIQTDCNKDEPVTKEFLNYKADFYQIINKKTTSNESLFKFDQDSLALTPRLELQLQTGGSKGLKVETNWTLGDRFPMTLKPPRTFFFIGTSLATPWTYQKRNPKSGALLYNSDGTPMLEGYCIDLAKKIAEHMDFDYQIVLPTWDGFGKKQPNGSWTGMIGDLTKGVTDIAIAATIMTSQREEVVDFVAPYFEQTGLSIVIRKPIRQTSLFKFMTVLRAEVWLSILAALTLTACLLSVLDRYSPYSARNRKEAYPYPCREFTLKESMWFALTSFTPQGGGEAPKSLSARALVAAYWLFVVLMLATFTANLAAFLTVERMQTPVSSLEQLAKQSRINYTVSEGHTAQKYFINMKHAEDTLYRIWKELTLNASADHVLYQVWDYPVREQYGHILLAINSSIPVQTPEEGFSKVNQHLDADFAFIHDSSEIKYHVTRNCNLTEVGEVFGERPFAIAVQQGSRLQEEMSKAVLVLQKQRFLEALKDKYWNNSMCPDNADAEGITLDSLGGVFIATLFGLALAMITLVWEVFYYKRKEKRINKVKDLLADKPPRDQHKKKKRPRLVSITSKKAFKNADLFRGSSVKQITFGDSFSPVRKPKVSYIEVGKANWNP